MKLKYIGNLKTGTFVYSNFKQEVVRGETYNIPDKYVDKFVGSGLWEKVKNKPRNTSEIKIDEENLEE